MRILHIAPAYPPSTGGGPSHMRALSEHLANRGHDVHVFTQDEQSVHTPTLHRTLSSAEDIRRVHVRRFKPHDYLSRLVDRLSRLPGGYRALSLAFNPAQIQALAHGPLIPKAIAAAARLKPDIVAVLGWYFAALPCQFCILRAFVTTPLVGIPLFHTEESWSRSEIYPSLLERCDGVLANTEHEARFIRAIAPHVPAVHVAGCGVDARDFVDRNGQRFRRRYGLDEHPIVGYVGRLGPEKGVTRLLEAMGLVWLAEPTARLVLAGQQYPPSSRTYRAMQLALDRLSEDARSKLIQVTSFGDAEKPSIFDAMDVFAMPSIAESFGIAYLEAWACEKPVIGARIGATQCVIEDGVDGLLVDPGNPRELADAILALLKDRERARRMGRAGYQKTLSQFTWEKITDEVEKVYFGLVRERGRRSRG